MGPTSRDDLISTREGEQQGRTRVDEQLEQLQQQLMAALAPGILLAIAGTSLAPYVIERMTDHGYRRWTRAIIFAISAVYLVRAAWLFWHGQR